MDRSVGAQVRCFRELWAQRLGAGESPRGVALHHAARAGSDLVTVDADDGERVLVAVSPGSTEPELDVTAPAVEALAGQQVIVLPASVDAGSLVVRHWVEFDCGIRPLPGDSTEHVLEVVRERLGSEPHDVLVLVATGPGPGDAPPVVARVVPTFDRPG